MRITPCIGLSSAERDGLLGSWVKPMKKTSAKIPDDGNCNLRITFKLRRVGWDRH